MFDQLLALDRSEHTTPIVRPPWNDSVEFKKLLDIGARTLLVPYVSTVEEAEAAVARVRYPTGGMRGVAGTIRASRYGRVKEYSTTASNEICLLVQIETQQGLDNLDDIAAVDGVDGVFIGTCSPYPGFGPDSYSSAQFTCSVEALICNFDLRLTALFTSLYAGPADLSAALGYLHDRNHPDVIATIKSMCVAVVFAFRVVFAIWSAASAV